MRRIITFLLVFLLASVASATPVTLVPIAEGAPGSATNPLQVSDTIRLLVTSDYPLVALNAILTVSGPGTIHGAIGLPEAAAYGWDPSLSFDPSGLGTTEVEIGMGNFMGNYNTVVAYFDIDCLGPGPVNVTLSPGMCYGGSGTLYHMPPVIGGQLTVYQVPEPMTFALLSLGGLFLLRRRR